MGKAIKSLFHPDQVVTPEEADVWFEFTEPKSALGNILWGAELGKQLVVGTTGWYESLPEAEEAVLSAHVGMVYAPNFAIGVHGWISLLKGAQDLLPGFDVTGYEMHHREKVDMPSGTARIAEETLGTAFESLRCGGVPGTHTAIFDADGETIEITHRARNRLPFAKGAVAAAKWVMGREGMFHFEEVLACK